MYGPPQLWALGDDGSDPAGDVALAAELAATAWGDHGLADRLRGAIGHEVRLCAPGVTLAGVVTDVLRDAVELATPEADWLVRLAALWRVRGPAVDPVAPAGRQRADGLAAVRSFGEVRIVLGLVDGSTDAGRLLGAGSDHLTLAAPGGWAHFPWPAVAWLRRG